METPAYMREETLYLPVSDIFTFLKIQNSPSPGYDTISGFFINQECTYMIDRPQNKIKYQDKVFDLKEGDMVRTETNLFLRSDYFGRVFGLQISFDFHALTATLSSNFELPIIREMRLELMRRDIRRLKGEIKADTVIGRRYPFFHFGMADWSVSAAENIGGKKNYWLSLALGSVIAGGEANILLAHTNQQPFAEKHQYYLWHYANNDRAALRQVMLGKIVTRSTASIYAPVVGMQVTNTPTTFRRSFGSYTLSDYTEPGWLVELYVNNVMVDYLKADASGFFTFEVPLVYGTSNILLRFYGPWGEERSRVKTISIPFNFLPVKQFEYSLSAGVLEDDANHTFSRANFSYGLSRRLTIGGGAEYLSSIKTGSIMPFVNFSARIASSLLVSGEYSYGIRFKGILSYRLPWNMQLELNYSKYHKDQKAVNTGFLEERRFALSIPIRVKRFASLVRFTLDQVLLMKSRNLTTELLISGIVFGVSANLTTYGLLYDPVHPYFYSILSLGLRLPARFILIPQVQYDYTHKQFVSFKIGTERQMFQNGVLSLSYEHNFAVNIQNLQIGFRYDFPFAQASATAIIGKNNTTLVQTARGSLIFDAKTKWVGANNMTSVGKGGLVLIPFLDMNANGKRDKGEPKVTGLNLHITGGRMEQNKRDSSIRVYDLEPFTSYFIEIDKNSFDNVSWQIRKPVISAAIDPNQFKLIEIPITVYGEGTGMVYVQRGGGLIGQGRIIVSFYRSDSTLAGRTLTEADGYFSFLGLTPGSYFVKVDPVQLSKLNMVVEPAFHTIVNTGSVDGDLEGGLDFVLTDLPADSISDTITVFKKPLPVPEVQKPVVKAPQDSLAKKIIMPEPEVLTGITVQAGAFHNQTNAINSKYRLQAVLNLPVSIVYESGYYKVRIAGIKNSEEARKLIIHLSETGYPGSFILKK